MKTDATQLLAGIMVPATSAVKHAIERAREKCEPYLFNHVMRSWLFAVRLGQIQDVRYDPEILAIATLLHDVTLNERFSGPRRFEVEGADLARDFAIINGLDARSAQMVWDGVALNSTPSIGLYKEPEVALCTASICLDVIGLQHELIPPDEMVQIIKEFPRLEMKSRMTRCLCQIAKTHPETSYDNFVRDFGERLVPGYKAPSSVDFITNAPFEE